MAAHTHDDKRHNEQDDVNYWKDKAHDVLAHPSGHLHHRSSDNARQWNNSFWSCFTPAETCCFSCCVPCITFGKTQHRMTRHGNMHDYEPLNTSCLLFGASGCCGACFLPTALQRQMIREKYNLEGSCVKDLVASICCMCCTLVQSDKEAADHEARMASSNQPGAAQQYQGNGAGMVYPTPPGDQQAAARAPNQESAAGT